MNTLISTPGFAIPLALLCVAVTCLAPLIDALPTGASAGSAARRRSYCFAAAILGTPVFVIGVIWLAVHLLLD
ncbi:hypothetical protein [Paraburkholderia sp. J94]|uniref:hypothetical protein n=1 Tax=Paraburkholderia sp. J94 TaxID=2805441 RepID=UPI002AAF226F|nr:hypothetical protein [Paraburkholderia sp. J94]